MKLLTHNLLSSHVRGVGTRGFPLRLQVTAQGLSPLIVQGKDFGARTYLAKPFSPQATEVRINPVEFNPDFVARMIPKVEWAALVQAADTVRTPPFLSPLGGRALPCRGGFGVCVPTDQVNLLFTVKLGRGTQRAD